MVHTNSQVRRGMTGSCRTAGLTGSVGGWKPCPILQIRKDRKKGWGPGTSRRRETYVRHPVPLLGRQIVTQFNRFPVVVIRRTGDARGIELERRGRDQRPL